MTGFNSMMQYSRDLKQNTDFEHQKKMHLKVQKLVILLAPVKLAIKKFSRKLSSTLTWMGIHFADQNLFLYYTKHADYTRAKHQIV